MGYDYERMDEVFEAQVNDILMNIDIMDIESTRDLKREIKGSLSRIGFVDVTVLLKKRGNTLMVSVEAFDREGDVHSFFSTMEGGEIVVNDR